MKFNKNTKTKFLVSLFLSSFSFLLYAESPEDLSKTEILGKEYYIYEVKKGESIYGVAKKFDWDVEELARLNAQITGSLKKGDRLYYPTGRETIVTEIQAPAEISANELEPITHKVKKGETVYSISRQYGIPLEIIYNSNPSTKKGVKAGETIIIPQNANAQFYFYSIKNDDTLSSISKKYNTSVEDILKNNAGLTASNLKEGDVIRLSINSNAGKIQTQLVEENRVAQLSGYKVSKNETWDNIAEKTGVEVETLKEANSENKELKQNDIVTVPVIETVTIEKTIDYEDPRELSYEGVKEIYDSIRGNQIDEELGQIIRIALIMDEPTSKKDIDFTRGFLIALSEFNNVPYKIDFKVMDGRGSSTNITDNLDDFEPSLVISTADKTFPLFLADYGNTNNVQIINVFDLKNDLYEDNGSMIQLLPPSSYFFDRLSTRLYQDNRNRKFVMVGERDENDGWASELFKLYDGNSENISLEEFGVYSPDSSQPILLYSTATRKEELNDFLKNVEILEKNNPELDFIIAGRTGWITYINDFGDRFNQFSVILPSRIWLDENSKGWKGFTKKYNEFFGGAPVRSIPNFAASGYDVATYFIPLLAANQGDFNKVNIIQDISGLQDEIELKRVNNWGGFINTTGYLLYFKPDGSMEKIQVK